MPSASTKPEKVASAEATDPIKIALSVVDKKVRNLEKRKGKLDAYRAKADQGEKLNKDQQDAIDRYDGVIQNLEFAKDLQKQFSIISADGDKVIKKQAKREKIERQAYELRRIKELLQLQNLLDNMGNDKVRDDFKSGKHNAVVLSDKDLHHLDELYKLISPTRDGPESYEDQLMAASEHVMHFLDGKEKDVLETTYKDLKLMVNKIQECGYFDQPHYEEEEEEPEPEQTEESENAPEESTYAVNPLDEETPEENTLEPQQPPPQQQQLPTSLASEVVEQPPQEEAPLSDNETSEQRMVDDAFFSTQPFPRQRPFQEIVSSVQGNFNFLQESQIDMESPHMDPAVVAAHPMAPVQIPHPAQTQQTDGSLTSQQTYQSGGLLGNEDPTPQSSHSQQQLESTNQQSTQATSQIPPSQQPNTNPQSQLSSVVNQQSQQSSSLVGQQVALESAYGTQQDYSQNLMSQSLPNSTSQYSDQSNYTSQMSGQPGLDQSMSSAGRTSDVPPAIPLPSQSGLPGQSLDGSLDAQSVLQSQGLQDPSLNPQGLSDQLVDSQEKKPFPMNTNAAVFRSMYSQPNIPQAGQPTGPMMTDDKGINMASEFHGAPFGSYNRNNPRGGPRGGNRGGRGGMNNGFNNRGRGGTGAPYNNGRGGFNGNRGTNGRGAYQGYPPRSDYRPEGYQSFGNSFGGFPKRGGGPPRGAPRGGAMSGGNMRRGNPRGGARGGFGNPRPSSGPHQGQQMQQAAA